MYWHGDGLGTTNPLSNHRLIKKEIYLQRIIGIDPGFAIVGYGIVDMKGSSIKPVTYGAITTDKDFSMPERLKIIYSNLSDLISEYNPDVAAVESLFFNKNTKTALLVSQARGVILLSFINSGVPMYEYTPLQIKQALVGYGRAEKMQIQNMVKLILNLKEAPKLDDTADALAAAICHANQATGIERLERGLK